MITHIEAYNLKDAHHGMSAGVTVGGDTLQDEAALTTTSEIHDSLINRLQKALNDGNVINLKSAIREIILDYDDQQAGLKYRMESLPPDSSQAADLADELKSMMERKLELIDILSDLETFHRSYSRRSLGSRIGSGSTGQAEHQFGMGFVVLDTLTARARRPFF
jgi:hypothetical protein